MLRLGTSLFASPSDGIGYHFYRFAFIITISKFVFPSFSSSSSLFYFIRQSAKIQAKILRRVSNENKYSRSLVYRFIERKSRDRRPTVQDVITHPESDLIPSPRPRRVPLPFRGQSALHKFSFEAGIACVHLRQDKCLPA